MNISKSVAYGGCALIATVIAHDFRLISASSRDDWLALFVDTGGPYLFKYIFAVAFFVVGLIHQRRDDRSKSIELFD